jgi:glycosyltransferase involved in cell wall biosynthesis
VVRVATVLNLVPVADTDRQAIASRLDVDDCVLIPGKEIRERGARAGLAFLREKHRESGADTFAIHSLDWGRQSQRTGLYALACLIPARKRFALDVSGHVSPLAWMGFVLNEIPYAIGQDLRGRRLVAATHALATKALNRPMQHRAASPDSIKRIVYMRTDLWFGVKAGGSIGHVAGVIDGFLKLGKDMHVISWEKPALIGDAARFTKIEPRRYFINERELALLDYDRTLIDGALPLLAQEKPDAIYARYSLDCYAPAVLAAKLNLPLIVEYNGSEVWIQQKWGRGLKFPKVAQAIEDWMLRAADLIVVVSKPLQDQLVGWGIPKERVLVNPNAVEPERFDPGRYPPDEIRKLRSDLGIGPEMTVAGFIGTFSPWHGVEVLADAIPLALRDCPKLHFLLIGSGPLLDSVKSKLAAANALDRVTFTGIVPQDEAPRYLLCSDFFLSPHVPNPDGTPFFGSPTKLFEYMALGKGIIASNLDQLGEILRDGETAILVPPGDPSALVQAISKLYNDRELSDRLGNAARIDALDKHTWRSHVERILGGLSGVRESV